MAYGFADLTAKRQGKLVGPKKPLEGAGNYDEERNLTCIDAGKGIESVDKPKKRKKKDKNEKEGSKISASIRTSFAGF